MFIVQCHTLFVNVGGQINDAFFYTYVFFPALLEQEKVTLALTNDILCRNIEEVGTICACLI